MFISINGSPVVEVDFMGVSFQSGKVYFDSSDGAIHSEDAEDIAISWDDYHAATFSPDCQLVELTICEGRRRSYRRF